MKHPLRILIFLLALPGCLYSQTLSEMRVVSGSAKFMPGELIDKSVIDANGDVCAGFKIRTDLEGLSFQSYNGIVKVNTMPGEYTLFLQPSERVVEVFKSGFAKLSIILADCGVALSSGRTWALELTRSITIEGVYFDIDNGREGLEYLTLKKNNHFFLRIDKDSVEGTYNVDNAKLYLKTATGTIFYDMTNKNSFDTLHDGMGRRWVVWHGGTTKEVVERAAHQFEQASREADRDAIIEDLSTIAVDAYQYKNQPRRVGGGGGSYAGYSISKAGAWGSNNLNGVYMIVRQTASILELEAISKHVTRASVRMIYDGNGKVIDGPHAKGY